MNKKGFTLVEVLAVIILLGVIIGIIVPIYNNSIESSKKNAFEETLNGLVRTIENYVASNPTGVYSVESPTNILSIDLEANNLNQLEAGSFYIDNNKVVLINVYDGVYCGNGSKNDYDIKKGRC